ncbi:MAG: hypothetical protein P4L98_11820 [Ancalomicrobiaceae bacterium]|nr:hypothetical protein [Ancalomicrobiaceae bacterium]
MPRHALHSFPAIAAVLSFPSANVQEDSPMGWHIRLSSGGGVHAVYSQQADNSCGIACIIMINFKLKKWQLGMAAAASVALGAWSNPIMDKVMHSAVKSEQEVYAAYAKLTGKAYDGSQYTDMGVLVDVLNELGIGRWSLEHVTNARLASRLMLGTRGPSAAPLMVHVKWRDNGGGHFVVCDEVDFEGTSLVADFCDPFDATVKTLAVSPGAGVTYDTKTGPDPFSFVAPHYDYSAGKTGDLTGWVAYRTKA